MRALFAATCAALRLVFCLLSKQLKQLDREFEEAKMHAKHPGRNGCQQHPRATLAGRRGKWRALARKFVDKSGSENDNDDDDDDGGGGGGGSDVSNGARGMRCETTAAIATTTRFDGRRCGRERRRPPSIEWRQRRAASSRCRRRRRRLAVEQ